MGYGRGPPTRAHKRRVMEFDCTKTAPRQLEGAAMNVPAGAGADTAPVHRVLFHLVSPGLELVVSLKTTAQTTSHHRVPAATACETVLFGVWVLPEGHRNLEDDFRKYVSAFSTTTDSTANPLPYL